MTIGLPMSLTVNGVEQPIVTDFRAAYEFMCVSSDPHLSAADKNILMLSYLYKCGNPDDPTDIETLFKNLGDVDEALEKARWFYDCGKDWKKQTNDKVMMDWEQDYPMIIAAVDKSVQTAESCLELQYMHWWTFIQKLTECPECRWTTFMNIRDKMAHGKKLEPQEREILKNNRDDIIIHSKTTFDDWGDD